MITTADIKKMSTDERIQAMEALWDALLHEDIEPVSPQWHEDILVERKKSLKNKNTKFMSIEELKASLK